MAEFDHKITKFLLNYVKDTGALPVTAKEEKDILINVSNLKSKKRGIKLYMKASCI